MTKDEIIQMAIDAGLNLYVNDLTEKQYIEVIEHFAKLVAQHEREACAKFIEHDYVRQFERPWRDDLSAAIRARGQA
jgi:hypothetical protein